MFEAHVMLSVQEREDTHRICKQSAGSCGSSNQQHRHDLAPEWFSSVPGPHMCGGDQSRRDAGLLGLTPRPLGGHHGRSVPASGLLSARTVCHGLILAYGKVTYPTPLYV